MCNHPEREDMEHRQIPTSNITIIDASKNNRAYRNHQRKKKRTTKRQQLPSLSLTSQHQQIPSLIITDPISNLPKTTIYVPFKQIEELPMKKPFLWTKIWTKWFASCGNERDSRTDMSISTTKRDRTKSENDVSKRATIEQDNKKKLSATISNYSIEQNEQQQSSRRSSHHHYQSNEKVNHSNTTLNRDRTRRYSNPFFTSARLGGGRTSITNIPTTTTTTTQQKQPSHLSRSVDRLHHKSPHRQLRYEEHDDYIPSPLYSIQCHPTIDHYTKSLNQKSYFSSNHRRSQIEAYQLSSIDHRVILPRPYSSSIPHSQSVHIMSKISADNNNNHPYGKLSDCHSLLTPLENSSVKAPRRIESHYSQFPIQQEPVYANTQSLYDNILFPQSGSKSGIRNNNNDNNSQERKSCASQTQLTWTMATFSSFVDLENQSAIVPPPDPNTLYSVVQHPQSPHTTEQTSRTSPRLLHLDDTNPSSSSHYQRPRSPLSSGSIMIEKRDGSFQTNLTIAPSQDIQSNTSLLKHESTPSPISTGSSTTPAHHHHHHRKHKSRNHSSGTVTTRDVGLQVNIQTVKRITFTPQKSDESSLTTTTPSSPGTVRTSRELKTVETNTEPLVTKHDMSTSYEPSIHFITSSSQTTDTSPTTTTATTTTNRQTKAAQTQNKTLRDQSIETNNLGLFVCDLSSLLKNSSDEVTSVSTKRKS